MTYLGYPIPGTYLGGESTDATYRIYRTNNTTTDPRCPHCGKPVIGVSVQGCEGSYHPACTQPDPVMVPLVNPWPWPTPLPFYVPPLDTYFKWTC